MHPITPMTAAAHILTLLHGAVIATRPARIALTILPGSCGDIPLLIEKFVRSYSRNASAEAAGAMNVFKAISYGMAVLEISTISYPDEALKNIQPTHSRSPPAMARGVSLASCALFKFWS